MHRASCPIRPLAHGCLVGAPLTSPRLHAALQVQGALGQLQGGGQAARGGGSCQEAAGGLGGPDGPTCPSPAHHQAYCRIPLDLALRLTQVLKLLVEEMGLDSQSCVSVADQLRTRLAALVLAPGEAPLKNELQAAERELHVRGEELGLAKRQAG